MFYKVINITFKCTKQPFDDAFRQDVKESFRFLTGSLKLFERTDSRK